jgi:hypothetical protein
MTTIRKLITFLRTATETKQSNNNLTTIDRYIS